MQIVDRPLLYRIYMQVVIIFACLCLCGVFPAAAETIEKNGTSYFDAELAEVNPAGAVYQVEGDKQWVVLPWSDLTASQLSAVKTKFPDGIDNAKYRASYVKGTVFQVTPDGVIIQIELGFKGGLVHKNGASLISSGLVIIPDLPSSVPREEGAAVEIIAHKQKTYTYDIGIAAKEISYLTVAKPPWGMEQDWKNKSGQIMHAKLLAVKGGKGLFERAGKRFIYDLSDLDADAQYRAQEIAEKLLGFPAP